MEAAGTIIISGVIDGENGDMPMQAFQWNTSATVAPAKPTRGAYDAGWTPTAPNRPTGTADYYLWMTQTVRHKATDGTITYDDWSTPVRISGDKGTPGEDSSDTEWIYKFDQSGYDGPTGQVNPSGAAGSGDTNKQQAGWVPKGWYDHALAVSSAAPTLYASYRRKAAGTNQQWGPFEQPIIWSHYGRNGIDGDGTEYVFIRTKKNVAPVMDSTQSGYNADEFRPTITSASQTSSQTEQAQTTDDPKGPDSSYPYEWVATRSKVPASQAAADGSRSWSKYTGKDGDYKMSLWAKWAADGENGDTMLASCSLGSITVACDSSGKVVAAMTSLLTFTLSRNGSQTPAPTVTVKSKPSGVTIRTIADTSAIPAGAASLAINAGESMDNLATGVVFVLSYQGYSAECNVAIVCTKAGDETPVYSIIPNPAAVNFRSNAVGDFTPSRRSVSVVVRKVSPSGSAPLSPSNNVIDGKYYLYCYDEESAEWFRFTSGSAYQSQVVTAADAQEGTITAVRFALSTASSTDAITANNTVAEAVVPVICDGHRGVQGEPGAQGEMGKMFYPMGEWNAQTTYSRTGDLVPLVFLPDPGNYNETIEAEGHCFYLYDDTSTGTRPVINDSSNPWRLCDTFGVVITQGLFAEFAKMGKGIFSGDYFFSMNGRIGNTEYRAGATIGGVPAYTRFCGDPSSLAGKVSVPSLSGPVSTDVYTIASVRLQPDVTFRATIVGRRTSSSGSYYFRLRDPNGTIRDSATISSATDVTQTLSYTATTAGTYTIVCYGSNSSVAVSFTADYGATGYFEPNWWVDLLTGKMSAARGNFVVDSNGDVHVKSGDVDVSGTIRATNLFHGDCLFQEGGKYSTDWWYVQAVVDTTPAGLSVGDYFTGDFPDPSTNTHDGMLQCTYDADMVMAVPDPNQNWGSIEANKTVVLPLPETFPGKTVEINSTQYGITGSKTFRVGCVGNDRFAHLMVFDGQGRVVRSTTSTLDTLTFAIGGIIRLHSMAAYQNGGYVYYWLDVTGSAN